MNVSLCELWERNIFLKIKYKLCSPGKHCFLQMKMQRFQVFEEVIMTKDSCSFCVYGLSLDSHRTDPSPSAPQWALHATQIFPSHLCSILFPLVLGACETLFLQSSVSLMNDFPNISITPPLHQFLDQQTLQMVYFDQIYQCKRVHLIEGSMNLNP